jgi:type IV pilus assembly protein PilC
VSYFIDFIYHILYNFDMVLFENSGAEDNNKKTPTLFQNAPKQSNNTSTKVNTQLQKTHIKLELLVLFTEQLASMLKAGLPLSHALDTIVSEIHDKKFYAILSYIKNAIFGGESFSSCLKQFPYAFPPLFYSMVEAGEVAGSLPDAMQTVAEYLSASLKLNKKFKSALTYPIVIISMSSLLVMGLMIWVVPVFGEMFSGFGANLPWLTQKLMNTSNFFKGNIFKIIVISALLWAGCKKFFRSPKGEKILDIFLQYVPIFGNLIKKTNIARFCRTYSVLLTSGVPILKSIDICTHVANSFYLTKACEKIKNGIQSGQQLSVLLESIPYFPRIVCNMTKAGEQSGNVEKMVRNVAILYENDVNNIVASITSLLEPFIICFLGVVIGGIVIAMFMPIFQLSSLVH